ncbi:hypothetical protein [Dyadobacter crusticola]|uniref:hypothetical protein n=1 Tax=Dyadobacter crusticola TaxID=292407 RepID=UPI00068B84CA|nr:hypothetical protein [Dyadobacter crusticola]
MKYKLYSYPFLSILILSSLIFPASYVFGQCKEKVSEANRKIVHYHDIRLSDKGEYLTFTRCDKERLFSYNNEELEMVYHVRMFTEIRVFSSRGNFSLYTTKSERAPWQPLMTLWTPITPTELQKMKGITRIEVIFSEEKRVFVFSAASIKLLQKALACMN